MYRGLQRGGASAHTRDRFAAEQDFAIAGSRGVEQILRPSIQSCRRQRLGKLAEPRLQPIQRYTKMEALRS